MWQRGVDKNFTPEKYNEMFIEQSGKCAVCEKHQSELTKKLCTDHDHKTGQVRWLLCWKCNYVLGIIEKDGIKHYHSLINYLIERETND